MYGGRLLPSDSQNSTASAGEVKGLIALTELSYTIPHYIINYRLISMAHTVREKPKLLARVRRIRGQIEALERALAADRDCAEVLRQIAAARGAINGLMAQVMEGHIRMHVADPKITSRAQRTQGAEEVISVIRTYLK